MFVSVNLCRFCAFFYFKNGFFFCLLGHIQVLCFLVYLILLFCFQMSVCFLRRPRKDKDLDRRGEGKPRGRVGGGEILTTFL